MKVYILPSEKDKFVHKLSLMSKHLEKMPRVEFSEPKWMKKKTRVIYDKGWGGIGKEVETIEVIEVTIEDIEQGQWVLVADVFYREGIVAMLSHKYFKDMPTKFGLDYKACDYCGKNHSNRTKAHVVFNPTTGEWKQIGSTCVSKMFGSEYLNSFTVQLYKIVEVCSGCMDPDLLNGWMARIPDHSWQKAYSVDALLPVVKGYRDEVDKQWQKSWFNTETRHKEPGTTDFLWDYYYENASRFELDEGLSKAVRGFVSSLADDEFNRDIRQAWEDQYIQKWEIYKVFFALKMYEDSLTVGQWENQKAAFVVGEKINLLNVSVVKKEEGRDEYGGFTYITFKNKEGILFGKSFTSTRALENDCKNPDETYSFSAKCVYIDDRKRMVKLGGRISRIK